MDNGSAPGRVTIREDVVFGKGGGRDLRCDVYVPPGEVRDAPAVLLLHGGAWRSGDRKQLRGYGVLLGREGYVCVASEYRLTPEEDWPAQIHDAKAALRWMRANAGELGIDPEKIAVEGNSAGGHLSLMLAATPGVEAFEGDGGSAGVPTHVAAAVGVYPPTLISHGERERGAVLALGLFGDNGSAELAAAASPLTYVGPEFPPTMLIHGTGDATVPPLASVLMYEALVKAGVPVELHMYAETPHAFDALPAFGRQCSAEMRLFLDRYVRDRALATAEARPGGARDVG
jgi:acetyl esterase/lipase